MELYCASGSRYLLITSPDGKRRLKGAPDIAMALFPYVECYDIAIGMRMGIELKKNVNPGILSKLFWN